MLLQINNLKQGLYALLILGVVTTHMLAANIGKGDVFGQGGYYTELGQGGARGPLSEAALGLTSAAVSRSSANSTTLRPSISLGGVSATGSLYQAGGGARMFILLHREHFRPYLPVVGGFLRGKASVAVNGLEYVHGWESDAFVGAGFGTEIGITIRCGFRYEFRYFREFWYPEFGQSSQNRPAGDDRRVLPTRRPVAD